MLFTVIILSTLALSSSYQCTNRILGGSFSVLGEFPYQISLRFDRNHVCGGSIIHELYILTAAHCVYEVNDPEKYTVLTGAVKLIGEGQIHEVASIKYHEEYSPETIENDIAIIKLKKPIRFNKYQKPVLLTTEDTPGGLKGKFSGWGLVACPGPIAFLLQKMDVITYDNKECQKFHDYGPEILDINDDISDIKPGMLCGFNKLNVGACKGDSGGPLVLPSPIGPVQVGIASWVWKPCALGVPDVYTRVYTYLDWINKTTDNLLHLV